MWGVCLFPTWGKAVLRRKLSRNRTVRFGVIGAAACLAIGGVVASLPGAYAGSGGTPPAVPLLGAGQTAAIMTKVPPGAVRATHGLPRVGKFGPVFQPHSAVSPRVVNGGVANPADFPSVVGIESLFTVKVDGNLVTYVRYCTGTVLSATKVLTAGHCAADVSYGDTVVIAGRGSLNTDTGGQVVGVTSSWIHPSFNVAALDDPNNAADPNLVPLDDVAVYTLATPLSSAYTPVALTAQGDQTPYAGGTSATIAGYGITNNTTPDPGVLHSAVVPIQSDATCAAAYPTQPPAAAGSLYDPTRMTCAGNPPNGADTCGGDSGGPLFVAGVEVGITDWGPDRCASSYGVYERLSKYHNDVLADLGRPGIVNLDWTGDGHTDLYGRDKSGNLFLYSGSGFTGGGFPAFDGGLLMNSGWNIYSKLFRVTNWNGDGTESIMAETPGGDLYRYDYQFPSDFDPRHTIATRVLIGSGWGAFSDIVVTNNWNGDNMPSLMARTRSGNLYIYNSDGHGGWSNPNGTLIGTGWTAFDTVLTPGNWLGNGHQVLLGRTPGGNLYEYEGDGHGGWLTGQGVLIGTGWNGFKIFQASGDLNGDDMMDVIGITPGGVMLLYTTDGHGNWLTGQGQQINAGWQVFNTVF